MQALHIRRGVLTDAAALVEFAARTFADTFASDNRPEDLQAHLASSYGVIQQSGELADPDVITLLAFRGHVLVAYAQVRRSLEPTCVTHEQPIELHRFYVDRSAQGTGAAAELSTHVEPCIVALFGALVPGTLGLIVESPTLVSRICTAVMTTHALTFMVDLCVALVVGVHNSALLLFRIEADDA